MFELSNKKSKGLIIFDIKEKFIHIAISEHNKNIEIIDLIEIEVPSGSTNSKGVVEENYQEEISKTIKKELEKHKINPKKYDLGFVVYNYTKKQKVLNDSMSDKDIIYYISDSQNGIFKSSDIDIEKYYFDYDFVADNEIMIYATEKSFIDTTRDFLQDIDSQVKLMAPEDEILMSAINKYYGETDEEQKDSFILNLLSEEYAVLYHTHPLEDGKNVFVNKNNIDFINYSEEKEDDLLLDEEGEEDSLTPIEQKILEVFQQKIELEGDNINLFLIGNIQEEMIDNINKKIDNKIKYIQTLNKIKSKRKISPLEESKYIFAITLAKRRFKNGKY